MSPETIEWLTEKMPSVYTRITTPEIAQKEVREDNDE